jgi:hypothetical protein
MGMSHETAVYIVQNLGNWGRTVAAVISVPKRRRTTTFEASKSDQSM